MRPSLRAGTGAHRGRAHTLGAGLSRSAGGAPDCAADIAFRFRASAVFLGLVTNWKQRAGPNNGPDLTGPCSWCLQTRNRGLQTQPQ